jgi:hypothetical protein
MGFPTVGAVYDRAIVAFEWRKRAVTDRAYSWEGGNSQSTRRPPSAVISKLPATTLFAQSAVFLKPPKGKK